MKFYLLSTSPLRSVPCLGESAPYSWVAQGTSETPHRQVQLPQWIWRLRDISLTAIARRYWNMLHEIQ